VNPHRKEIVKFINKHLENASKTQQFKPPIDLFFVILWIIYLSMAVSWGTLVTLVQLLMPEVEQKEIRNKLFCLTLAGWIKTEEYNTKKYYFVRYDSDPFAYAFTKNAPDHDSARRKLVVTKALTDLEAAPKHIRQVAAARQKVRP